LNHDHDIIFLQGQHETTVLNDVPDAPAETTTPAEPVHDVHPSDVPEITAEPVQNPFTAEPVHDVYPSDVPEITADATESTTVRHI
jgi:hypothetical protein